MRIVKRNKYLYLQHSFRKNNKVITKEKYVGKKIPRNLDKIRRSFLSKCLVLQYKPSLEKIKTSFQEEWRKYPKSQKEKIIEQLAIIFTYNTNAIEGSTITLDETRELLEHHIAPNKPLRDIKESENHYSIFKQMLYKKERLNNKLILKWHKELFKETKPDIAGSFRKYDVRVGPHIAPEWNKVKPLMNFFINFYNKSKNLNQVELAARTHYIFETIHPFGDGNGRIGRLIMNYIMWHSKYPMLIIEYKKRISYYKALQKGEDGFTSYFIRTYLKAHKKYLKS